MSRRVVVAGACVALALLAGAVYWFQPHKLFIDERANEAVPTNARLEPTSRAGAPGERAAEPESAPAAVAQGTFVSLDHATTGRTRVLALADGRRILRLERLDTSNGPDLFVYLSREPARGRESAFDDDYVSLGRLKANQGDQNYEIPADVDLARYASVVIWCDRFDSAFGAADLQRT